MAYLFYTISFTLLLSATSKSVTPIFYSNSTNHNLTAIKVLYITRARWLPLIPIPESIYSYLPSSFQADIESGFSSSAFDLQANVASGDSRAGLDERGKREVQRIMRSRHVGFDEARRLYTEQRFAKNNIGPDGLPRDPKFVSFS